MPRKRDLDAAADTAQRLYEAWVERPDAFVRAGRIGADMRFRIAPGSIVEDIVQARGPDALFGDTDYFGRAVLDALEGIPYGVNVEPYGGPKVGGPVSAAQYIVELVGVAGDALGLIVNLAAGAVLVRKVLGRLEEVSREQVLVSDGPAMMLAAQAIFDATGRTDLTLAFTTPLSRYTPSLGEWDHALTSWLVGYRGDTDLYLAIVHYDGTVELPALGLKGDIALPPDRPYKLAGE